MHMRNITQPTSAPVADPLHQSLIADIDSIWEEPMEWILQEGQPKVHFTVWIESLNRPVISKLQSHPNCGFLDLYTSQELAQDDLQGFAKKHRWDTEDLTVRRITFVEALHICREIPTPLKLVRRMGTVERLFGVLVLGEESAWIHEL
jgi:hypothetical protein